MSDGPITFKSKTMAAFHIS
jgi:hypothetical protein